MSKDILDKKVHCDECYDSIKQCLDDIESLIDMVIWMSGSQDFSKSGTAYIGWREMSIKLREIMVRHRTAKCISCKDGMPETTADNHKNVFYCNCSESPYYQKPMEITDSCDKWKPYAAEINNNNGPTGQIVALRYYNARLLYIVKRAYRKHVLNDDSIGWEELGDSMCNILCEVMTDRGFQDWLAKTK